MKMNFVMTAAVLLVACLLAHPAKADIVLAPIDSHLNDAGVFSNNTVQWIGQNPTRVGRDGSGGGGGDAFVAVFELPALTAGHTIASADFQFEVTVTATNFANDVAWNVDVYGLRSSNAATVLGTDFFLGANDGGGDESPR